MAEPDRVAIARKFNIDPDRLAWYVVRTKRQINSTRVMVPRLVTRAELAASMQRHLDFKDGVIEHCNKLAFGDLSDREAMLLEPLFDHYACEKAIPQVTDILAEAGIVNGPGEDPERSKGRGLMQARIFKKRAILRPLLSAYTNLTGIPRAEVTCWRDYNSGSGDFVGEFYEFMQDLAPHVGLTVGEVDSIAAYFAENKREV